MKLRYRAAAVAVLAASALTGCANSSSVTADERVGAQPATPDRTANSPAATAGLVKLTSATSREASCLDPSSATEWAWATVEAKTLADLSSVDFTVTGDGVRAVGDAFILRPTESGDPIGYSGTVEWEDRASLLETELLAPGSDYTTTDSTWTPDEGENVLVAFRLRLDDDVLAGRRVATLTAVTTAAASGDSHREETVAVNASWASGRACEDLNHDDE